MNMFSCKWRMSWGTLCDGEPSIHIIVHQIRHPGSGYRSDLPEKSFRSTEPPVLDIDRAAADDALGLQDGNIIQHEIGH